MHYLEYLTNAPSVLATMLKAKQVWPVPRGTVAFPAWEQLRALPFL